MKTVIKLGAVVIILLYSAQIKSQSFFIKGQAGYGLPTQKQIIGVYYATTYDENIYGSFGGGINISAALGYFTKSHIGFEALLGYSTGQKVTVPGMLTKEFRGSLISVSPSMIFIMNNEKKVNPYLKAGFLTGLPLMKLTVGGTDVKHFRGGIPFGYNGSLGIRIKVLEPVSIFGEIYHASLVWFPRSRKESDGTVVKFYDKIDYPYPSGQEPLHHTFPYNSTGINLGLLLEIK
ncbi:MAG: porin family protein [Sphingobacteriales bacterium]|nr:porin family protein [Sphingobacteriales bacterium]